MTMTGDALVFVALGALGLLYVIEGYRLKLGPHQKWWHWVAWIGLLAVVFVACLAFAKLVKSIL